MSTETWSEMTASEVWSVLPRVLPAGWTCMGQSEDGAAYRGVGGLRVIASVCRERDGKRWIHVSVSRERRLPDWDDLRLVKDVFIGKDRLALQILPREADYYNVHPFCLHLWSCLDGDPVPDMRKDGHL